MIEKEARDRVIKYYKDLDGVAVVIINGIDMQILDGERGKDVQELDFLIINYSKQYILNIEVKRSLTHVQIGVIQKLCWQEEVGRCLTKCQQM